MNQNQNNQQQPQRNWNQVQGGGDAGTRWEPQKKEFNPQDPYNIIQGYFKEVLEKKGPEGLFNVIQIHTVNQNGSLGELFDCTATKVLNEQLEKITIGSYICIKYCGKVQAKTGGRSYHTWETFVDLNAIPYSQLAGVAKASAPVAAPPVQHQQVAAPAPVFQNPPQQQAAAPVFAPQGSTQQAPPAQTQSSPPVSAPGTFPGANAPASPVNPGGQGSAPVFQNPFKNANDDLPF